MFREDYLNNHMGEIPQHTQLLSIQFIPPACLITLACGLGDGDLLTHLPFRAALLEADIPQYLKLGHLCLPWFCYSMAV